MSPKYFEYKDSCSYFDGLKTFPFPPLCLCNIFMKSFARLLATTCMKLYFQSLSNPMDAVLQERTFMELRDKLQIEIGQMEASLKLQFAPI